MIDKYYIYTTLILLVIASGLSLYNILYSTSTQKKLQNNRPICKLNNEITKLTIDYNNSNNLYIMFDNLYLGWNGDKFILVDGTVKNIEFNEMCVFGITDRKYISYGQYYLSVGDNETLTLTDIPAATEFEIVIYDGIPILKINGMYVCKNLRIKSVANTTEYAICDIIDRDTDATIINELKEGYVNLRDYPDNVARKIYGREPFNGSLNENDSNSLNNIDDTSIIGENNTENEKYKYDGLCNDYANADGKMQTDKYKFCMENNDLCDETTRYNFAPDQSNINSYNSDLQRYNIQVKMENLNRTNDLLKKEREITEAIDMMKDTFNNILIRDIAKEYYFNKDTKYYML